MRMISRTVLCSFALASLLFGSVAAHAQRPAQGPISRDVIQPEKLGYRLVWEDEFNGTKLDTTKWSHRGLGARAIAVVSEDAVEVKDGYIYLWAKRDAAGRMLGSAIGTEQTFMSRYGYYECRAQVQKSWGQWGAFWLQSTQISAGEDPAVYGAEIDVMECFRKLGPDIISHNVHWAYGPNQKSTRGMQSTLKGLGTGFHTYGVEWTPEKYTFYVDGMKFYEVAQGISKIKEYMILSMEYPGNMQDMVRSILPDAMIVDYVRVWQKPGVN